LARLGDNLFESTKGPVETADGVEFGIDEPVRLISLGAGDSVAGGTLRTAFGSGRPGKSDHRAAEEMHFPT